MKTKNFNLVYGLIVAVMMGIVFVGCKKYDDDISNLEKRVGNVENRVTNIEEQMKTVNEDIKNIKTIVDNVEKNNYVTNVTQTENGYTLTFNGGEKVTITNGKDGAKGEKGDKGDQGEKGDKGDKGDQGEKGDKGDQGDKGEKGDKGDDGEVARVPVIGVKQGTDGNWYWTVDGEFLTDDNDDYVRANGIDGAQGAQGAQGPQGPQGGQGAQGAQGPQGPQGAQGPAGKNGVTPQLRINETSNEWEVSYDDGNTWKSLGVKATGEKGETGDAGTSDPYFKSVTVGDESVTFVLADGITIFELPIFDEFKKVRDRVQSIVYVPDYFDGQIGVVKNNTAQTVKYQVKPVAVAKYLAEHKEAMKFVGEDVTVTRAASSASFAVTDAAASNDGLLTLTVTPSGFEAQKGYAFALDMEAEGSSYRTTYTPAFLIVEPEKIDLGVVGLFPNMGVVTVGKYLQLFVVFYPDYTTSRGITWSSDNTALGTVDKNGIVAVAADKTATGEFTITATTTNGKTASLKFKVADGAIQIDTTQLNQEQAQ